MSALWQYLSIIICCVNMQLHIFNEIIYLRIRQKCNWRAVTISTGQEKSNQSRWDIFNRWHMRMVHPCQTVRVSFSRTGLGRHGPIVGVALSGRNNICRTGLVVSSISIECTWKFNTWYIHLHRKCYIKAIQAIQPILDLRLSLKMCNFDGNK